MVLDHLGEYRSVYAACQAIGPKVGVGAESLRRWVLRAQVDAAERPGVTTAEAQRILDLEREVRDLKEANVIFGRVEPSRNAGDSRSWEDSSYGTCEQVSR
jgi:transposase